MSRVDVGGTEVTLFDPHPIQIIGVIITEPAKIIGKNCMQHVEIEKLSNVAITRKSGYF